MNKFLASIFLKYHRWYTVLSAFWYISRKVSLYFQIFSRAFGFFLRIYLLLDLRDGKSLALLPACLSLPLSEQILSFQGIKDFDQGSNRIVSLLRNQIWSKIRKLEGFLALEMKPECRMIHETDLFAEIIIRVWFVDPDFLKNEFSEQGYQILASTYFRWISTIFLCLQRVYELVLRFQSSPMRASLQDTRSNNLEDSALRLWTSSLSQQNHQRAQQFSLSAFLRFSKYRELHTRLNTKSVWVYFLEDAQSDIWFSYGLYHDMAGYDMASPWPTVHHWGSVNQISNLVGLERFRIHILE